MAETLGTGWLNKNSLRNYPLSQSATGISSDGSFELPDDLLLDMKLAVPFVYSSGASAGSINPAKFYLSSLKVYPQGFVFFIGCDSKPKIAVSDPIAFSAAANSTVAIRGLAEGSAANYDFSQAYGWAVLGNLESLKSKVGDISFTLAGGRLESSVLTYGLRRISGFKVFSDTNVSSLISGQVLLSSGSNHRMKVDGNDTAGYTVQMIAVSSADFQEICECADIDLGPCIRKINGISPDSNGNIDINEGTCITVTNGSNAVTLKEICAKPCCGCTELETLVADVTALTSQLTFLQTQIGLLNASVTTLQDSCLASRVDSTSCNPDSE
jgi:hypothetical protein